MHPEDITMVKVGNFYRVYGKDAYIIAYLFKYKISEENDIMVSGFPTSSIKKVEARLENKKINYIVLDRLKCFWYVFKFLKSVLSFTA